MASTQVSGSMDTVTAKIGQSVVLQTCGFDLPGYKFTGWNTKADGTGDAYADASTVLNLSQDDGTTATLYAQWEPLSYDIVMKAENQEETISATFDESVELRWPGSSLSKSIIGWEGYGLGSFYADGSTVTNLCGLSQDGTLVNDEVALSAVVADDGTAYLAITNDGEGVGLSDPSNQITLTDKDGTEFHPDWVTAGAGFMRLYLTRHLTLVLPSCLTESISFPSRGGILGRQLSTSKAVPAYSHSNTSPLRLWQMIIQTHG